MIDHIVIVYGKDFRKEFYLHASVFSYNPSWHSFTVRCKGWDNIANMIAILNPRKVTIMQSSIDKVA